MIGKETSQSNPKVEHLRDQVNMAGRKAVRPIHISDYSFILLYRFEGSQNQRTFGGLAQLEERVLCKHEVTGSSPVFSTTRADSSVG